MSRWVFLGKVWLLVAAIRIALTLLPFSAVRRLVRRWGRRTPRLAGLGSRRADTVAGAVARTARFVPGASCLTRALATHVLLARAGRSPRLRIGVATGPGGGLEAHAWVETADGVTIGAAAPLLPLAPLPAPGRSGR